MQKSISILATVALGAILAVSATTTSMARDVSSRKATESHRVSGTLRCSDDFDHGFGGFSGAPGHPFMGPGYDGNFRDDWGGHYWDEDPFWTLDPYYPGYDGTAYVERAPHGRTARHCL